MTDKSVIILNLRKDKRCPDKLAKIVSRVDREVTNTNNEVLQLHYCEPDKPHAMIVMTELPKQGARREYIRALSEIDGIEAAF